MNLPGKATLLSALLLVLTACPGGKTPVPKPEAYPRIATPDSVYTEYNAGGTAILAFNASAEVSAEERPDGSAWLTVTYPSVPEATVYLTLLRAPSPDSLPAMLANRRERMSLNLSGARATLTELTSPAGWEGEMLSAGTEALSTPVQILASHPDGRLLSGALYLRLPAGTAPDSIAPFIRAVDRDMLTLLKSLR